MNLAFSSDAERRLQELLGRYPTARPRYSALPWRANSTLSPEAMDLVARRLSSTAVMLGLRLPYDVHDRLDAIDSGRRNVACHLKGSITQPIS